MYPMSSLQFEVVRESDVPIADYELRDILNQVYVEGGFTESVRAETLFAPAAVRARGELLHARSAEGDLLGIVILVRPHSSGRRFALPEECELHLLATLPRARRTGVGTALVKTALAMASSEGYRKAILWTQPPMLSAQRLYRAVGFVRVPERDFTQGDQVFLFMESSLGS
jgi:GNAT superfamily N-acetyltransferase